MKNLLNKNISIYEYNLLNDYDLKDFINLCEDFYYDEEEINNLIYGREGLLEQKIYKIQMVVDYGAKMIISINPK